MAIQGKLPKQVLRCSVSTRRMQAVLKAQIDKDDNDAPSPR